MSRLFLLLTVLLLGAVAWTAIARHTPPSVPERVKVDDEPEEDQ